MYFGSTLQQIALCTIQFASAVFSENSVKLEVHLSSLIYLAPLYHKSLSAPSFHNCGVQCILLYVKLLHRITKTLILVIFNMLLAVSALETANSQQWVHHNYMPLLRLAA